MPKYTARSPIALFVRPEAVAAFAELGVRTLGSLATLPLATWWRIARADFNALARGAALASVQPKGGAQIELLLQRSTRNNLTDGLRRLGTPQAMTIAELLLREGITSLTLVSALSPRELRDYVPGMNPEYVRLLARFVASQNAQLARR